MSTFLLHMLKTAVWLAGFYTVYFFFLSGDTSYRRNRIFLLSAMMLALILPFFMINVKVDNSIFYLGKTLGEVYVTAERSAVTSINPEGTHAGITNYINIIYIIGIGVFSLKLAADLTSLLVLIIRNSKNRERVLRFSGFNTSGFSAMGHIFINCSVSEDEAETITSHEESHLRNRHFNDILFLEIVSIFQWFNPVIWMINRSLRAVHEYEADKGCLTSGMTTVKYQNLLLSHLLRSKIFLASNSFSNPSLVRKRMIMMSKSPTGLAANLKLLLVVPVALVILMAISAFEISRKDLNRNESAKDIERKEVILNIEEPESYRKPVNPKVEAGFVDPASLLPPPSPVIPDQADGQKDLKEERIPEVTEVGEVPPEEVFVVVEEMPQYPGGDKSLMDYIYKNINYPESAKERGVEGRVILRFAIMYDGTVDKVQVIRGVDPDLDREAVRVISGLERWSPGKQGGKPVNVWYSVPVSFTLK